jgi:hypothetical protein
MIRIQDRMTGVRQPQREHSMEPMSPTLPTSSTWPQLCLRRLHRLLELTPEAAPDDLAPIEAFALLEWCRIAVFAECHEAGVGDSATSMLRGARRRPTLSA